MIFTGVLRALGLGKQGIPFPSGALIVLSRLMALLKGASTHFISSPFSRQTSQSPRCTPAISPTSGARQPAQMKPRLGLRPKSAGKREPEIGSAASRSWPKTMLAARVDPVVLGTGSGTIKGAPAVGRATAQRATGAASGVARQRGRAAVTMTGATARCPRRALSPPLVRRPPIVIATTADRDRADANENGSGTESAIVRGTGNATATENETGAEEEEAAAAGMTTWRRAARKSTAVTRNGAGEAPAKRRGDTAVTGARDVR